MNTSLPWHYYRAGEDLEKRGCLSQALSFYFQAIQIKHDFEEPHWKLWYLPLETNHLEQLISDFKTMVKSEKTFMPLVHLTLGNLLTKKANISEAIKFYKKASYQHSLLLNPQWITRKNDLEQIQMPYFIIVGFGRCGTTSLHEYISQHPRVIPVVEKEIDFFSLEFDKGVNWYLAHFPFAPEGETFVTGESSPSYISSHMAEKRLNDRFPDTKIIVLLRNPVYRVISYYHHRVKFHGENRKLGEIVDKEIKNVQILLNNNIKNLGHFNRASPYIAYSLYVFFLKQWVPVFPKNQMLILRSEEMFQEPDRVMKKVFSFLELEKCTIDNFFEFNQSFAPLPDESIMLRLFDFFKKYNTALEEYLNIKFNWDKCL